MQSLGAGETVAPLARPAAPIAVADLLPQPTALPPACPPPVATFLANSALPTLGEAPKLVAFALPVAE